MSNVYQCFREPSLALIVHVAVVALHARVLSFYLARTPGARNSVRERGRFSPLLLSLSLSLSLSSLPFHKNSARSGHPRLSDRRRWAGSVATDSGSGGPVRQSRRRGTTMGCCCGGCGGDAGLKRSSPFRGSPQPLDGGNREWEGEPWLQPPTPTPSLTGQVEEPRPSLAAAATVESGREGRKKNMLRPERIISWLHGG
jgi:hypothetical protein